MDALCGVICVWCRCVLNVVAFPNQSLYLWCEIRVVVFSVAFRNMCSVSICNYVIEFGNSVINLCGGPCV